MMKKYYVSPVVLSDGRPNIVGHLRVYQTKKEAKENTPRCLWSQIKAIDLPAENG